MVGYIIKALKSVNVFSLLDDRDVVSPRGAVVLCDGELTREIVNENVKNI